MTSRTPGPGSAAKARARGVADAGEDAGVQYAVSRHVVVRRALGRCARAFKGGAIYGFGALLRLVWSAIYQPTSPYGLPRQLVSARPPTRFTVMARSPKSAEAHLIERIHGYLSGQSEELIEWLTRMVRTEELSLFHRNFIAANMEMLQRFFENGPRRILRLKREHGLDAGLVAKDELDDLLALSVERAELSVKR